MREGILTIDQQMLTAPDPASDLMPVNTDSFWEGLLEILTEALPQIMPSMSECLKVCLSVLAVVLLLSILETLPGNSKISADLAGCAAIGILLLRPANSLIQLGVDTIQSVSEYCKLLLPVMTAALAGSGGTTTSAALYAGTAVFDALLTSLISNLIIPILYVFLCFSIMNSALGNDTLKKLSGFMKWLATWSIKIVLYTFTGYISITGVISGSTDAAALKATKLTISGMVPVVGGILSDASEAILVGAGLVRNTTGIYGLLAITALCIRPFLKIGAQYLLLKSTGAVSSIFGSKRCVTLIQDFTWIMGLLLAMTGAGCLMVVLSVICFMRGVG